MELFTVSQVIFEKYLTTNNFKELPGGMFHSSNFVNDNGEVMAYIETSSYGSATIYKIADP